MITCWAIVRFNRPMGGKLTELRHPHSLKTTELSDFSDGLTHTFLKNNFNNYNNIAAAIIFQTTELSDFSEGLTHSGKKKTINTRNTIFIDIRRDVFSKL